MKDFNMDRIVPEIEKSPSARLMTSKEMAEFADVLMQLRDGGYGDKTINEMVETLDKEIILKLGKKDSEQIEEEILGKSE